MNGPGLRREQVLAHRTHLQSLSEPARPDDLDVLLLGLQDTPGGSAALGLRTRTVDIAVDSPELALVLSARGSPHLHRRRDLPLLRTALPPSDQDELIGLLGECGGVLVQAGVDPGALLDDIGAAMRAVFPGDGATKGELSAAVTAHVPDRQVWRSVHSPGVLLVNGDVAGTWRRRRRGSVLELDVRPFVALAPGLRDALDSKGAAVADAAGARDVELRVSE